MVAPMVYFDHNATSPMTQEALRVWNEAALEWIGNPSSLHRAGARAEAAIAAAREEVASFLGCHPLDLVWTSGATESNNMVFHHLRQTESSADREVWVSAIEHPSALSSARRYFPKQLRLIPVSNSGVVELQWLEENLRRQTPSLVAVMAANNETGVLQPWREVLHLCRQYEVPFFTDAVQWIGKLPAAALGGSDFVSASAHKFGGPKGIGFLKVPSQGRFETLLCGGPQEEGRRGGTQNVPGICALAAALKERESALASHQRQVRTVWQEKFLRQFLDQFPGAAIISLDAPRLWNTISVIMPETPCPARWVVKLDKLGFAVSTGSACSSGKERPSHVLEAMGYSPSQCARALRFSSAWESTEQEWLSLLEALRKAARELGSEPGSGS
jgi:cysteine desulfurase